MQNQLVNIIHLEKSFSSTKAVHDLSFSISKGEVIMIIGPNGSGKSTTLDLILGIQHPTKGEVQFWSTNYRSLVGVQLQSTPFFPGLTAKENLLLFANFYKRKLSEGQLTHILRLCSLESVANTEVTKLSGGQQKRLSIGLALVHLPELVFLDEPTAALDPRARKEVHQTITEIQKQGTTVVITSHDMDEVTKLADRILFFHSGTKIAEGTASELCAQYGVQNLEELYINLTKDGVHE
ncbi:ABC transporter ATP-binding protein [Bacillus massiliigorillae]|uniref:ABC transporter ATP-binding protein n=1 Tax=Bacillus massiliigorillae TaxID=1243664 RepID=UPI0003AAB855|nr:ABC transporter ATP-binding protein [Bacillus massiliigorillae]